MKDRELKDRDTGNIAISSPGWGTPWHIARVSYIELEAALARLSESTDGTVPVETTGLSVSPGSPVSIAQEESGKKPSDVE